MNQSKTPAGSSGDFLTAETLRKAVAVWEALLSAPQQKPVMLCHPIDKPFYEKIFSNINETQEATVWRLWNECARKYEMGSRKNIQKWKLRPLIEQYRAKLAQV